MAEGLGASARKAFLFDPNLCTGCQACEIACTIENRLDGTSWREVTTFNEARRPEAPVIHLSLACNHCADAPCAEHCPALAYSRHPVTGLVTLHADRCIGCKYCSWACPYDAPKFDAANGVMTKCTFCGHRQEKGLEPACVVQCPTGALGFGDLETLPGEKTNFGLPTIEPRPSIRFIPWRGKELPANDGAGVPEPAPKISLASEWPLAGFTLIAAALVATFSAAAGGALEIQPPVFVAAALASMALSSLHLGKKLRAWRAVLNVRRSWLSREIVLYPTFVGLATLYFMTSEAWCLYGAVVLGFASLFAMDRVYDLVLRHEPYRLHSADVLLTGVLLSALLLGSPRLALLLGTLKLVLYVARKIRRRDKVSWSVLRVGSGFVAPLVLGLADPEGWPAWALAGTAIGEVVDRCELYTELRVPTPREQMARR